MTIRPSAWIWICLFVFSIATLKSQTLITSSNPYSQNWDAATLANDGWEVSGGDDIVETLVARDSGQSWEINADFSEITTNIALLNSPSFRLEGASELSELMVSLDLFMNKVGFARTTLELFNTSATSETLRWHLSNDAMNVWQTHSFLLENHDATISGDDFDLSSDFRISFLMDGTDWGDDSGNIMRVDNFSLRIIPEAKSSLAALCLCLLVILKTRCRNRKPLRL